MKLSQTLMILGSLNALMACSPTPVSVSHREGRTTEIDINRKKSEDAKEGVKQSKIELEPITSQCECSEEERIQAESSKSNKNSIANIMENEGSETSSKMCESNVLAPATRVRRLSNREIINTLNAAMGSDRLSINDLGLDLRYAHFENNADANRASIQFTEDMLKLADQISEEIVGSNNTFFKCNLNSRISSSCFNGFLTSFVSTLYRRDMKNQDATILGGLLEDFRAQSARDETVALKALIQYLVNSPEFLYRTELGSESGTSSNIRMTPFEIASYLSYAILEDIGPP